jgi:hypothetical protein
MRLAGIILKRVAGIKLVTALFKRTVSRTTATPVHQRQQQQQQQHANSKGKRIKAPSRQCYSIPLAVDLVAVDQSVGVLVLGSSYLPASAWAARGLHRFANPS